MRAAMVERIEGPSGVRVVEAQRPAPQAGEVLIDVHAAGVGFPDLLHTKGAYQRRSELPFTLGAEIAGVVSEAAAGLGFSVGDRVAAIPLVGGFADAVCVPHGFVFPLPPGVTFTTGAAAVSNYLTAHYALIQRARLRAGETVLVHGAAGGLGLAATQLAKQYGAVVIAVVSSEEKARVAHLAGADHVVAAASFRDEARAATGGRGVDVVVDPVGGDRLIDSLRSLAVHGRHLVLGFAAGSIPELKVNRLLLSNIDMLGVQWAPGAGITGEYARAQWDQLAPLLADGRLAPTIDCELELEQVREALIRLEQRRAVGKVVLRVRPDAPRVHNPFE